VSVRATALGVVAVLLVAPAALRAQRGATPADSLLREGAIARAESLYYAAARAHPRDPEARFALGRYLISRGALRVGATLVEEAVRFGLDSSVGAATLGPVYLQIGEYRALAALPAPSLGAGELARARWLMDHPSRTVAPDSIIVASYRPASAGDTIGTITIRVNGRAVDAPITARVHGLVLADTSAIAPLLRRFSASGTAKRVTPAAADSIGIGRLSISNVPVAIATGVGASAMLGLDALTQYAPTFDPGARRIELHPTGAPSTVPSGAMVLQTLRVDSDLLVARGGGWASVASPLLGTLLRERRWTADMKRGRILVER
jgi:hypothetical protein